MVPPRNRQGTKSGKKEKRNERPIAAILIQIVAEKRKERDSRGRYAAEGYYRQRQGNGFRRFLRLWILQKRRR